MRFVSSMTRTQYKIRAVRKVANRSNYFGFSFNINSTLRERIKARVDLT